MIILAHLLVGDEKPVFLRFLMPEMTFLAHIHSIVQKYSPDVDLYALHKLNRYDAV